MFLISVTAGEINTVLTLDSLLCLAQQHRPLLGCPQRSQRTRGTSGRSTCTEISAEQARAKRMTYDLHELTQSRTCYQGPAWRRTPPTPHHSQPLTARLKLTLAHIKTNKAS